MRFLRSLQLVASFAFCSLLRAADTKPLNVVVLFADDWRFDTLGCAGNPEVKTPNLDRLASDGFRFTQNCVTTSICGVSRASLFSGQWMSHHGNPAMQAFKTPWAETYPGLQTGLVRLPRGIVAPGRGGGRPVK